VAHAREERRLGFAVFVRVHFCGGEAEQDKAEQ